MPIFDLMKLQGEMRIVFIERGINEELALDLAAEALHLVLESPVAKDEYKDAYWQTTKEEANNENISTE